MIMYEVRDVVVVLVSVVVHVNHFFCENSCFQCLVGFTPFYADDPVTTCRKILRWSQFLDIPDEVANSLSADCIDFMLSLIIDSKNRLG